MSTENTQKKKRSPLDNLKPFKPGETGNPNGRPKGSRNKFSEAFLKDFLQEWEDGGKEALKAVRQKDPSAFIRVAASIIPKEFTLNEGDHSLERLFEQLGDKELNQLIAGLCALGSSGEVAKGEAEAGVAEQPGSVH